MVITNTRLFYRPDILISKTRVVLFSRFLKYYWDADCLPASLLKYYHVL